jgi:hypothetical protein
MSDLVKLPEPELIFGYDQPLEDPRDGLCLFGPLKENAPFGIRYGLIGTDEGINRFFRWKKRALKSWAHPEVSKRSLWVPFPGFEAAFGIPFSDTASSELLIDSTTLRGILREDDPYQRVYQTVKLYVDAIIDFYRRADESINLWYVVSPESVFRECRPKSTIDDPIKIVSQEAIRKRKKMARQSQLGQSLVFPEQQADYDAYLFDNDFRRQLKSRLMIERVKDPVQILRETTLTPEDFLDKWGNQERDLEPDSQIAWNVLSATFYKAGGKPWKLNAIREGVCYLGMVFKKLENSDNERFACCAAQMFLDSGDGMVFQGAVGPWKSAKREDFHLNKETAKEIINKAVEAYKITFGKNKNPKEIFIHGKAFLNDEEWSGFSSVANLGINVVGVRIGPANLRVFRPGRFPVLRGLALVESKSKAYLWSTGFIPRLNTYPHQGVPYPLEIEVCKGEAEILTVLRDILSLTKLNYNACHFADGKPITLQFADKIGDILTAAPIEKDKAPLPFKFYI